MTKWVGNETGRCEVRILSSEKMDLSWDGGCLSETQKVEGLHGTQGPDWWALPGRASSRLLSPSVAAQARPSSPMWSPPMLPARPALPPPACPMIPGELPEGQPRGFARCSGLHCICFPLLDVDSLCTSRSQDREKWVVFCDQVCSGPSLPSHQGEG